MNLDWFGTWSERHFEQLRESAPDPMSEAGVADYAIVRRRFADLHLTEADADRLTEELRIEAPSPKLHLRKLMAAARELVAARMQAHAGGSLEDSRARSKGCPECSGLGLTSRYVWLKQYQRPGSVGFCCHRCSAGRWIADFYRNQPEKEARIPDLADWPIYQDERLKTAWVPEACDAFAADWEPPAPARTHVDQERAVRESHDCPECQGTGWARRRFRWRNLRPVWVQLYCRCSCGYWRESNRVADSEDDVYESLQSQPATWDDRLSHWTWSSRPTAALFPLPAEAQYLRPDDPTPGATPREALAVPLTTS